MKVRTIYKLMTAAEWDAAWAEGVYRGSEQDQRDGFIHFSTARRSPRRRGNISPALPISFSSPSDTDVIEKLHAPANEGQQAGQSEGSPLRWEPSRGGDPFPHLYALLPSTAVQSAAPAPLADDGTPIIPPDLPS